MKKTKIIENEAGRFEIAVFVNATTEVVDSYNASTHDTDKRRVSMHTTVINKDGTEWKRFNSSDYELKMHLENAEKEINRIGVSKRTESQPTQTEKLLKSQGYQ